PEDEFDFINISIHGIDESTVQGAPKLPQISENIQRYLNNRVCVSHTHFDRVAIRQAFDKYKITPPETTWLDSAMVARRTWDQFSRRGYGLSNLCSYLGYTFAHHDALEDAKASGHIINAAIQKSGLEIEMWLKRVRQPIDIVNSSEAPNIKRVRQPIDIVNSSEDPYIKREGNPEGVLYGEVVVFTGALEIHRAQAANMASNMGCRVESGVNRETTILIVGDQDVKRLAGHEKSIKHRKAEGLIGKGQPIRILRESDFKCLFDLD
ncbi:MAG: exonuclease domain-containing protein, partial [Calditrichota bacterium]